MKNTPPLTNLPLLRSAFFTFLFLFTLFSLQAQRHQLVEKIPFGIDTLAAHVQVQLLASNEVAYTLAESDSEIWTLHFQWGEPEIKDRESGQIVSFQSKAWVANEGSTNLMAWLQFEIEGLTNQDRIWNPGHIKVGKNDEGITLAEKTGNARFFMTPWDKENINITITLTDQFGTAVKLARYRFQLTKDTNL